ncbi:TraR/DksA C4-type zinc finger protein [Rhodanobacter sp. OK091]|uniref:TraR/DksA family transcriptional regulator n=1 Tax=Rhodanobacter sp. OK091 TaxID=1881037 RepID=UPI00091DE394|nr:TraR/DksA C4-type zinc finger protein [Rhodanobacter sp. OK091]SHM15210.1 transcriptional regulator, TraR/DksA family [Rhodanobacter sp. OK091]
MNKREQAPTHEALDQDFLDAQRARLIKLRDDLTKVADVAGEEEEAVQFEAGGEARDDADSAEGMAIQENDEAVFHRNVGRLAQVIRALERMDKGVYGLSEKSGSPIPKARLIAVPEATLTLDEEERRD